MGQHQTLIIEGTLPDLNAWIDLERAAPMGAARLKRETQDAIIANIRAQHLRPVRAYPVHLAYRWCCPNRRKDRRNVAFAAKFVEDALQEAGILRNDGWADLTDPDDTFTVDKVRPRLEVDLVEPDAPVPEDVVCPAPEAPPPLRLPRNPARTSRSRRAWTEWARQRRLI